MQIHGLNKTTLLDFPGYIAAVIFTGACNFRCPFCHNKNLVLTPHLEPTIETKEILAFLEKRAGLLEGLCITGGEPTLQPDLKDFIKEVRQMGYLIKLDTNGYRPDVLRSLLEEGFLDYVAMDIKSDRESYSRVCGMPDLNIHVIEASIELLKNSSIAYEFRTTIFREAHGFNQITDIAEWLHGCRSYYLQVYKDSENVIDPGYHPHTRERMYEFQEILLKHIPLVEIRGLD